MLLLGVTGRARVGKDTFGRYLVSEHAFEQAYFAKPLKDMLGALGFPEKDFQTTEEKEAVIPGINRSYRYLAQKLGTEWGRNLVHPDIWLLMMERRWNELRECAQRTGEYPGGLVITDVRFENEAGWVRRAGGVVVHVRSNADRSGMTAATAGHVSEAGVAFVEGADYYIYNDYESPSDESLFAFHSEIDRLIECIALERAA